MGTEEPTHHVAAAVAVVTIAEDVLARATAAATKAAGATKAKAAPAPKATKSKPAAAPRAPSRAAGGKRKREEDDDAAPVAQRKNAAAARVSAPAAPAVRAQAGHNLRRTKAVSYKV